MRLMKQHMHGIPTPSIPIFPHASRAAAKLRSGDPPSVPSSDLFEPPWSRCSRSCEAAAAAAAAAAISPSAFSVLTSNPFEHPQTPLNPVRLLISPSLTSTSHNAPTPALHKIHGLPNSMFLQSSRPRDRPAGPLAGKRRWMYRYMQPSRAPSALDCTPCARDASAAGCMQLVEIVDAPYR